MDESNSSKTLAKHNKYRKAKYTSQDFRAKAIEARDELQANVDFLMEVIRKDRYRLKHYEEQFGDLYYRPIVSKGSEDGSIEPKYGNPTEIVLEPLASKYRATIKSLLDSIKLINTELLPEDNPEGETSEASAADKEEATNKRQSLREQFQSMSKNPSAFTPAEPESTDDEDLEEFTNKVKQGLADADNARTKTTKQVKTEVQSWKQSTPRVQTKVIEKPKSNSVVSEPSVKSEEKKPIDTEGPKGLSPMMRARLTGGGLSRMDQLKAKYSKGESEDSEDE
jgi:predicted transcriptional regulator